MAFEKDTVAPRSSRKLLALPLVALITLFAVYHAESRLVAVEGLEPSSAMTACFVNYGKPREALGEFLPSGDTLTSLSTFHWKTEAQLERGLLQLLADAREAGLDGSGRVGFRRGAVDIVFASNHSLRVPVPGDDGARVGEIIVDRTRPSPAREGMLAVLQRIAREHAGEFEGVRIYNFFLLNCGSWEDADDHEILCDAAVALTGRRPAHILTTSGKVVPDPRHVQAGYATGLPMTIYDSLPGADGDRTRVFLHLAAGGVYDFVSGRGRGIERERGVTLKEPEPRASPGGERR